MKRQFEFDTFFGVDHDELNETGELDELTYEREIREIAETVCRRAMFYWYNEGRSLEVGQGVLGCSKGRYHASWNVNEKWAFTRRCFATATEATEFEQKAGGIITNTLERTIGTKVTTVNLN